MIRPNFRLVDGAAGEPQLHFARSLDVNPDSIDCANGGGPAALRADRLVQGKAKPAPEEQTGLEVGAKAPKFTLNDQDGKKRSLDEFVGKGKVALVFYRSADW
jgi:AhpC/TSA family